MGAAQSNARPILTRPVPAGTPKWGAQWKKATAQTYQHAMSLSTHGSSYSYNDCWLDLDPDLQGRFGRPLMRMTFDFHDNELKMSAFLTDRLAEIARSAGSGGVDCQPAQRPLHDHEPTRQRITPAAPSWVPIARRACSIVIARAGMSTMCSYLAAHPYSRKIMDTIQPTRSAHWHTGLPTLLKIDT